MLPGKKKHKTRFYCFDIWSCRNHRIHICALARKAPGKSRWKLLI